MKSLFLFITLFFASEAIAQSKEPVLQRAFAELEKDPQLKHALLGFYVIDNAGKTVFEKNMDIGMVPASTLKVVTSASAFELLGKAFTFKTEIAVDNEVVTGNLNGNLYFIGGSDPTLGSSRWSATKADVIFQKVKKLLADNKIKKINGDLIVDEKRFLYPPIPTGWIWEDVGNYYGAGSWGLNWLENRYAVHLASSPEVGRSVRIVSTSPSLFADLITNHVLSAAKGSGDTAYLFSAPYSERIIATGTIPAASNDFVIYGSMPEPGKIFLAEMKNALANIITLNAASTKSIARPLRVIGTVYSPPLDSINYWFLKESVNLYGEALINNIALQQGKKVTTAAGVDIVKSFWAENGIDKAALKIIDGSGLSPANRVTPKALVRVLGYAKSKSWFPSFYNALPELNGIKMKSGYIGGVRSYAGYVKSKSGEEYTFA